MASELDAAVGDQLPDLLATAMALTGRSEAAADLVGEVMVLARRHRDGVDLGDPAPGLRNQLVARYVGHRPARAPADAVPVDRGTADPGDRGADEPEELGPPDELEQLTRDFDRLSRPQRAALLLSFRDRLSYAEIAGILDRPVNKVSQSLASAQSQLDQTPYAITAALDRLGRAAPDPADARAAAVRFGWCRGVRRRRISVLLGTAVLVLALAIAGPTVIWPLLFPAPVRASAEWAYGYRVAAPAGFHVGERFLERDQDSSYLVEDVNPEGGCSIEASGVGPTPAMPSGSTSVKVNGRPGWIDESEDGAKELTWVYAPQAVVTVSCDARADPEELLLDVARGITFTPVPLTLPFRLSALPAGYEVSAVGTSSELSPGDPDPVSGLVLAPVGAGEEADTSIFVIMPGDRPTGRDLQTVTVNGTDAVVKSGDGAITLCLPVQNILACLSASSDPTGGSRSAHDRDVRRLVTLAAAVAFAADVGDRTTWFDARDALPD